MDCKTARLLLAFVRPNNPTEIDAAEAEELQRHLDGCGACAALAHDERRVDDRLSRAMLDVPLPSGLRERLLTRLGVEREAWRRAWFVRGLGAAAALLLAAWLGYTFWAPAVLPFPLELVNEQFNEVSFKDPKKAPEDIKNIYREKFGVEMVAPPDLEYHSLLTYQVVVVKNQKVPYLVFKNQGHTAHVYVVSRRQFDDEGARAALGRLMSGEFTLQVEKIRDTNFFYVIFYSGDRNLFVKPTQRPDV